MLSTGITLSAACLLLIDLSAAAMDYNPPTLQPAELVGESPAKGARVRAVLEKRENCGDGYRCLFGDCCGTGCADNCCAHDAGGVGCGILEECSFDGNVFIGCCPIAPLERCTGEATRITVSMPHSTITLPTADPTTEEPTTATPTSTSDTDDPDTSSESPSRAGPSPSGPRPTPSGPNNSRSTPSVPTSGTQSNPETESPGPDDSPTGGQDEAPTLPSAGKAAPTLAPANLRDLQVLPVVALGALLL